MSIWLDECDSNDLRVKSPHHQCDHDGVHEAHVWRGTTVEFAGACEVTCTYWCEGITSELEETP